ncbi:MAG: UDPGP type 1 family protein [Planctomycetes bacterium]|nr:UDPGP type 1 family protein [Planctomycetota bacterium]
MNAREDRLRRAAMAAGQEHLFRHWTSLSEASRARLLDEIESVDFALVGHHRSLARGEVAAAKQPAFAPADVFPLERDADQEARAVAARKRGVEALAEGHVGYLLVAGGQASRLGYDGPKGAYRIGPVSDWSLFEIHARRLRAAAARYGRPAPWYVMTSRGNDAQTREFFAEHGYFGLDARDVMFFSQSMVPALDFEGRILMAGEDRLFLAPNGHGGSLEAFARSGALEDARRRGLRHLSYFQVDNPLAPPADPLFLGLHALEGASMSSKVVEKRNAGEKVGVIGRVDGQLSCIEYTDLPSELREARDEQGKLRFGAGNIALHVLDIEFVAELNRGGLQLPWHLARKSMEVWEAGALVKKQGVKFETFVFDALGRSERSVTLEVARHREFSPVKNSTGEDSPATTRADLCRLHSEWIRSAGLPLPVPDEGGLHPVEVDPLLAEDLETFVARGPNRPEVRGHGHLYR